MGKPDILGIQAFSSGVVLEEWWQWVLVAIIIASGLVGTAAFLWQAYRSIRKFIKSSKATRSLPLSVQECIRLLSQCSDVVCQKHTAPHKPSSFGVYLGALNSPVTADEARLLSQWEAVVLDYREPGVLDAVSEGTIPMGPQTIARLDLLEALSFSALQNEHDMCRAADTLASTIQQTIRQTGKRRYFTGVLIANWRERLSIPLLNGLTMLIAAYGLDIYLEITSPDFLDGVDDLELHRFDGVVVCNGTILPNGERRDFFDMDKMKTTTKAFVSQACQRPFITMMWDTVADEADLSHAVVRRAHMWCSYHGAVPFISRQCALTNIHEARSLEEPLSAFQWLKTRRVMGVHDVSRTARVLSKESTSVLEDYLPLQKIFPLINHALAGPNGSDMNLDASFSSISAATTQRSSVDEEFSSKSITAMEYAEVDENGRPLSSPAQLLGSKSPEWVSVAGMRATDPLSCAFDGTLYKGLGCFPIGLNASRVDFDHVLKSQRRLRKLNLLSKVSAKELHQASTILNSYGLHDSVLFDTTPMLREAIVGLATMLAETTDETHDYYPFQVYSGLDSGFHTPTGNQFWSVWESEQKSGSLVMYLSKSMHDLTTVLLHTQLSRLGFSRYECFLAEQGLSEYEGNSSVRPSLPHRLQEDLNLLSTSDIVLFLQHLQLTEWDRQCPLLSQIRTQCETLLIELPTYLHFKKLSNMDYISGAITSEQLVTAKLQWYHLSRLPSLERDDALNLFVHISTMFYDILWRRDHAKLDELTSAIESLASQGSLDSTSDFVLFSLFCAARQAAFEEVYIEVSDRNPLFNQYSDQSAAFAELFALGSRCETYFDIKPSDIGVLLSKKHRDHYNTAEHQPPMWLFNAPSYASAYAAAETDVDPNQKASVMPAYRRFTFLSVFAIPALVDIILLSTLGRGLYLSTSMTEGQLEFATHALMCSLLLSGAIGTWISIGGTYYLISMAFSAANMFVLTRLIGGLALTLAGCILGFIVISSVVGPGEGVVFFLYLFGLTTYLVILAVLSTYQIPGSSFLNGRKIIIMVIPTLVIAPILTMFIPGHDIYIYLGVLYGFIALLVLGTRRVATQWVLWYHGIKTLNDADVKEWFIQRHAEQKRALAAGASNTARLSKDSSLATGITRYSQVRPEPIEEATEIFGDLSEPAILALCRKELYAAVMKENNRRLWQKATSDKLVKQLSDCWDSTLFLLDWYCRTTETKRPIPFSSTWNLETQVALESMQQSQKGIRLHNSFIHWRTAGDEVYCGVLYFVVALMDRWLSILHGGRQVGLGGDSNNDTVRLSVGLGLAYYLIGAVLLDYKAQHLHTLSEQMSPISIENSAQIRVAKANDKKFRRHLYLGTLCRFIGVHVWALALCAAMIWIFNGSSTGLIMFLAYVGAYSGLLLYQYNKIFSGPHALTPLLIAVVLGLGIGSILTDLFSDFPYTNVIALAISTWTAALLSFGTAQLGLPDTLNIRRWILKTFRGSPQTQSIGVDNIVGAAFQHRSSDHRYHAYNGGGADEEFSQSELEAFCDMIQAAPKESRYRVSPTSHPGERIIALLPKGTHEIHSEMAVQAYPNLPLWVQGIVRAWKQDVIRVFIVPFQKITEVGANVRAISYCDSVHMTLYIASDESDSASGQHNVNSNAQLIAETLLHASMKSIFGLSHHQAAIAESLVGSWRAENEDYVVSECTRQAVSSMVSGPQAAAFEHICRKDLLQHLCLGFDCDTDWDTLPLEIRQLFLRRCLGERGGYTKFELSWINTNISAEKSCTITSRIARYDLGALVAVNKLGYFLSRASQSASNKEYRQMTTDIQEDYHPVLNHSTNSMVRIFTEYIRLPIAYVYHICGAWLKFFILACMADPEYQRELNGALNKTPNVLAWPARFFLTGLWMYSRITMSIALPFFLYHGRKDLAGLAGTVKGRVITQKKNRLIIRSHGDAETAFVHTSDSGQFKLISYPGDLKQEPEWGHVRVAYYDNHKMQMNRREEFKSGKVVNVYTYDYALQTPQRRMQITKAKDSRIPMSRTCLSGAEEGAKVFYNRKGHITSGSYLRDGSLVRFKYRYRKNAKFDDELLRAEFVLAHMSANVSWCAPPVRHAEKMERWIPTPRVHEATFVQGADVYECTWFYDHKYHPSITTKLNGEVVDTPDMIRHDWLGVLKKPTRCSFSDENPLLSFNAPTTSFLSTLCRTNVKQQEISTSKARSQLWKAWKKRIDLDGVVVRWVDEELIRKEPLLKTYWRRRDRGSLLKAEDYLALHADAIMASSDLTSDISAWTPLAIRLSDLFSFGQGGDAVIFTRTKTLQRDTEDTMHVLAVDTGTWPNEGGGVSACRRDLINNLRTIKWHMVVESANDFGLPKHQTEENVESLKVIPLWGLDFMHPNHGMFNNKLDSEVDHLVKEATIADIKVNFIPTLTALVRGARAIDVTAADVKQATRALVNLNTYFEHSRHWKEVWTSDIVKDTWRELWLADDMPNAQPTSEWFRTELPTLSHFDTALDLWFRYLFIFSIPIPDKVPQVFQASHHSVSASYGIVCKLKRNCTLQIWDHAISWRETNLYLSSAMCTMPPFIRNSLLGLMKLTSTLILHHADQILPCADFFNPGWEVEIGSSKGKLTHRNVFRRKVDPIVNGITDMQKFSPVTEIKTKKPTVTMLSHVWFAKDIKTALLAADIIANEWGFKDYQLDIYGALNKSPVYSSECQELLACKGLGQQVAMRGTSDPAKVLADTWLFLNSSVSEGLPLALGEAALTGAPVVCTDVGASLRVLTDPDDGKRYSEVVAPNDAYGLARAQINILGMLDEWAQYADDAPGVAVPILPHKPTPEDVKLITARMYEKSDHRRKLGMMARNIVQKSFGGERYLREHEQMLWVGKALHEMRGVEKRIPEPQGPTRMQSLRARLPRQQLVEETPINSMYDPQMEKMLHPRPPWRGSAATSFSSVWLDEPSGTSIYQDPIWTREESVNYRPNSPGKNANPAEQDWQTLLTRPPRAYSHNKAASTVSSSSGESSQRSFQPPHRSPTPSRTNSSLQVPRSESRQSAFMRLSLAEYESKRSSARPRSHLNEMELVEYGTGNRNP
ncbi:hypothetical protein NX059_009290 [Plenodomus lindquistii]|nr:hypothetical protein NX059_009290 [Plenodomus lindquistii]